MRGHSAAVAYARALFALANERDQIDAVAGDLDTLVAAVRGSEVGRSFGLPWVSPAAKRSVAAEVASRCGVSPLACDFLALIAARGRADLLEAIAAAYRELSDAGRGVVRARVRTAVALDDEARRALRSRLGRVAGGTQLVLEETVDPGLLGGFVAEIGSLIVDGSLDGQLARLRERLAVG